MPCGGFVNNHDRSGCFRRRQSDQSSRVDAPVFGGMLAASVLDIFIIPMLYVVFQQLREQAAGFRSGADRQCDVEDERPGGRGLTHGTMKSAGAPAPCHSCAAQFAQKSRSSRTCEASSWTRAWAARRTGVLAAP